MAIKVEAPRTVFARMFRAPVYPLEWRYLPSVGDGITDKESARRVIHDMEQHRAHPGAIDWSKIMPYPGPAYWAMGRVNDSAGQAAYPEPIPGVAMEYVDPLKVGAESIKGGVALIAIGTGIGSAAAAGYPYAFVYLTMTAARNFVADLWPKHGFDREAWSRNLRHFKWAKMTDALLTSSASYLIMLASIPAISEMAGPAAHAVIPVTNTLTSGAVHSSARYLRDFSTKIALLDFLRPLVGNLGGMGAFLLMGGSFENRQDSYLYLMLQHAFGELWSGLLEARAKWAEKIEKRHRNLSRMLDLESYRSTDPEALAAISLAFMVAVKSRGSQAVHFARNADFLGYVDLMGLRTEYGDEVVRKLIRRSQVDRFGRILPKTADRVDLDDRDHPLAEWARKNVQSGVVAKQGEFLSLLRRLEDVMTDDSRIRAAAHSLFPESWAQYGDEMWAQFEENRAMYMARI